MAGSERARHWRYGELPGVDLLRARCVEKRFVRHTHENFVIAAILDGIEVFHHGGAGPVRGARSTGTGQSRHSAHRACGRARGMAVRSGPPVAGTRGGDRCRDHLIRGTPGFRSPVLDDPSRRRAGTAARPAPGRTAARRAARRSHRPADLRRQTPSSYRTQRPRSSPQRPSHCCCVHLSCSPWPPPWR